MSLTGSKPTHHDEAFKVPIMLDIIWIFLKNSAVNMGIMRVFLWCLSSQQQLNFAVLHAFISTYIPHYILILSVRSSHWILWVIKMSLLSKGLSESITPMFIISQLFSLSVRWPHLFHLTMFLRTSFLTIRVWFNCRVSFTSQAVMQTDFIEITDAAINCWSAVQLTGSGSVSVSHSWALRRYDFNELMMTGC